MPTIGGAAGSKGAVIIVRSRAESVPWLMGIALGNPVVPLVNSTSASRSSFSTRVRVLGAAGDEIGRAEHLAVDGLLERGAVRLAGHADGTAPGRAHELLELRRLQLHVHQGGGGADAGGAEDHDGRCQPADVDDRDPITGSDPAAARTAAQFETAAATSP